MDDHHHPRPSRNWELKKKAPGRDVYRQEMMDGSRMGRRRWACTIVQIGSNRLITWLSSTPRFSVHTEFRENNEGKKGKKSQPTHPLQQTKIDATQVPTKCPEKEEDDSSPHTQEFCNHPMQQCCKIAPLDEAVKLWVELSWDFSFLFLFFFFGCCYCGHRQCFFEGILWRSQSGDFP